MHSLNNACNSLGATISQSLPLLFSVSPSDDIQKLNQNYDFKVISLILQWVCSAITSSFIASGACAGLAARIWSAKLKQQLWNLQKRSLQAEIPQSWNYAHISCSLCVAVLFFFYLLNMQVGSACSTSPYTQNRVQLYCPPEDEIVLSSQQNRKAAPEHEQYIK